MLAFARRVSKRILAAAKAMREGIMSETKSSKNGLKPTWAVLLASTMIFAAAFGLAASAAAQTKAPWPKARPSDVRSINSIVLASYKAISTGPNGKRDLARFQSLFTPGAQLVDLSDKNGKPSTHVLTIQELVAALSQYPPKQSDCEREIARRTWRYGNLAQVWSTNQFGICGKPKTARYGINDITLAWDGTRWWIIAASWKNETPGHPFPTEYLPRKAR
jgi:hypothetical protein